MSGEYYTKNSIGWWYSRIANKKTRIAAFENLFKYPMKKEIGLAAHASNLSDAVGAFTWSKTPQGFTTWHEFGKKDEDLLPYPYDMVELKFGMDIVVGDKIVISDDRYLQTNFDCNLVLGKPMIVEKVLYSEKGWTICLPEARRIRSELHMSRSINKVTDKATTMSDFAMYDRLENKDSGVPYIYVCDYLYNDGYAIVELVHWSPGASTREGMNGVPSCYESQGDNTYKNLVKSNLKHARPDPDFKKPEVSDTLKRGTDSTFKDPPSLENAYRKGYWPGTTIKSLVDDELTYTLQQGVSYSGTSIVASINGNNGHGAYVYYNGKWATINKRGPITGDILEYLGYVPGICFRPHNSCQEFVYLGDIDIDNTLNIVTCVVGKTSEGHPRKAYLYYKGEWAEIIQTKVKADKYRTNLQWLMLIPDVTIRNKAINYLYDESTKMSTATTTAVSLSNSIRQSFQFRLTEEGTDYWHRIAIGYENFNPDTAGISNNQKSEEDGKARRSEEYIGTSIQANRPTADVRCGPEVRGNSIQGKVPGTAVAVGYLSNTEISG